MVPMMRVVIPQNTAVWLRADSPTISRIAPAARLRIAVNAYAPPRTEIEKHNAATMLVVATSIFLNRWLFVRRMMSSAVIV